MELRKRPWAGPPRAAQKALSEFEYRPLDPRKREIRLLELAQGQPGSRISAHLFVASLDDKPTYDALSYTWGLPRPTYDINIDGRAFPVGRNLRRALDDLRYVDRPRIVWTDAICINQPDEDEKSHQIKLMRTVYGSASVVCAWINHNVQPKGLVFEDLENLGKGVEIDDVADASYWYPVADIFRNPYWRRLWIQQELILAPRIQIYCGRDVFEGQKLLAFQHRVNRVKFEVLPVASPEYHISRYIDGINVANGPSPHPQVMSGGVLRAQQNLREGRLEHGERADKISDLKITNRRLGSSLLNLFLQSLGLNMTNPKDRVYGVLGMAADVDETKFDVDYGIPVASVYAKVFAHFITKYRSLSFLPFDSSHFEGSVVREEGLPSWMPHCTMDWGTINASRACGNTLAEKASIDVKSLVLSAEGVHIDTIAFIGRRHDPQHTLTVLEWLAQVEELCQRLWPEEQDHPLYAKADVTALFFPWLSKDRYAAANGGRLKKPDAEERANLLRNLCASAKLVDEPDKFSMDQVLWGGYHPHNAVPSATREALLPMGPDIKGNVLFGTEGGSLGKTHKSIQFRPGDEIWIISGCRMPLILRPEPGEMGSFTLLGPAVVPPVMRGEAILEADGVTLKTSKMVQIV